MIKRELYMSRIRPFIGSDLIKVMTGIRRCGKSVMLELVKQELTESRCPVRLSLSQSILKICAIPICKPQRLCTMRLRREPPKWDDKVYLFFDEIQEVKDWEKCVNSLRVSLDCDIYITGSNAKLLLR